MNSKTLVNSSLIDKVSKIDATLLCLSQCADDLARNPTDYACLYSHAISAIRSDLSEILETLETSR